MKQTPCIETPDGILHVPRPSSVAAGQSRSIWISRLTGKESRICSPEVWDLLAKQYGTKVLVEQGDSWAFRVGDENKEEP